MTHLSQSMATPGLWSVRLESNSKNLVVSIDKNQLSFAKILEEKVPIFSASYKHWKILTKILDDVCHPRNILCDCQNFWLDG